MSLWKEWRETPQRLWINRISVRIHFWVGTVATLYILVMSTTGSLIVFRNQLSPRFGTEWFVYLHSNLLSGDIGRWINGIGASSLLVLCFTGAIIWWPGTRRWRRSLTVKWNARFGRINWDLHNALGFWTFLFLLVWGISGFYFCFPALFDPLYRLGAAGNTGLAWLTDLHFGRFNGVTQIVWAIIGLVPAVLAITGLFVCCRRVFFKKNDKP